MLGVPLWVWEEYVGSDTVGLGRVCWECQCGSGKSMLGVTLWVWEEYVGSATVGLGRVWWECLGRWFRVILSADLSIELILCNVV